MQQVFPTVILIDLELERNAYTPEHRYCECTLHYACPAVEAAGCVMQNSASYCELGLLEINSNSEWHNAEQLQHNVLRPSAKGCLLPTCISVWTLRLPNRVVPQSNAVKDGTDVHVQYRVYVFARLCACLPNNASVNMVADEQTRPEATHVGDRQGQPAAAPRHVATGGCNSRPDTASKPA